LLVVVIAKPQAIADAPPARLSDRSRASRKFHATLAFSYKLLKNNDFQDQASFWPRRWQAYTDDWCRAGPAICAAMTSENPPCVRLLGPYDVRAMIDLIDVRYVRLGTADLEAAIRFATEIIGLEVVRREDGRIYLRGDDRDHNVVYFEGDPADHVLGFELADEYGLEDAIAALKAADIPHRRGSEAECADRRVMDFVEFRDPTGNRFDLVSRPFHGTRRYFPTRDAGITEFSHVGLRTTDAPRDEAFWTTHFNIHANDWIGPAALMSFDAVHHRIALFPADRPGIQHVNFQVASIDDVMRSFHFLTDRQVRIVFGPGRHATSGAMFLYFEGPDGMVYEYSHGVRMIDDPGYRPRQFPFTPEAFCVWGARPDIPEFRD
jgi:2,3-dihydroxy-p-cumate/2,3-dihydroxybenzoate 3,4-dioxygenase